MLVFSFLFVVVLGLVCCFLVFGFFFVYVCVCFHRIFFFFVFSNLSTQDFDNQKNRTKNSPNYRSNPTTEHAKTSNAYNTAAPSEKPCPEQLPWK